jgi:integrase
VKQLRGHFQVRRRQRDPDLASVRLWRWSRTTAWRHVKAIMAAAGITGTQAMPKGLRHGFGVNAFQSNVPPHLVQRWLGHASLRTTGIYADVIGPDERGFAARMWGTQVERPRARRRGGGETKDRRERGHRFHSESEKYGQSKEWGGRHVGQIF